MFGLMTTRPAHLLVKPWVYPGIQKMRIAPFCTKPVAEAQKEQREFEELGNKIDNRFKAWQEELQQFNDQLQKENELGAQCSQRQNDFMSNVCIRGFNRTFKVGKNFNNIECDYRRNFSNSDMRFGLAAGVVLGLFILYNLGDKDEKETKATKPKFVDSL